ncbi:MAG: hypothetical protein JWQ11_79 [Rhizobacter sp.]|nr:hypothetical protein [Rhizobacter sp.]
MARMREAARAPGRPKEGGTLSEGRSLYSSNGVSSLT